MRRIFTGFFLTCLCCIGYGQQKKQHNISIAFVNTNTAAPFGKFSGIFSGIYHPGFEIGDSFNWKSAEKHDWFQNIKLGYFYHRFVQQSFLLYTEGGYRYKLSSRFSGDAAIGAGYLHSIPGTQVYKLDGDGNYKTAKGIGRPQAMADFSLGLAYSVFPNHARPVKVFLTYQQRLQFPFVKSYVPLLPYNSIMLGGSVPFHKKS